MAGTRPIIPPEFVRGSMRVFMACREHPVLFYTYSALEALAWGAESRSISFDCDWFFERFGIPQGTLLRHLPLLAKQPIHAILVYRSAGAGNRHVDVTLAGCDDADASLKNETVAEMRIALVVNNDSSNKELKNKTGLKNDTVSKMIPEAERPNIFKMYEDNIGPLTPLLADTLKDAERDYPPEWIDAAFEIAVGGNKRFWKYIEGILMRWKAAGQMTRKEGKNATDRKSIPVVISAADESAALAVLAMQGSC